MGGLDNKNQDFKSQRYRIMLTQKVKLSRNDRIFQILTYAALLGVWELVAKQIDLPLIWPSVIDILRGLVESVTDVKIMTNLSITMSRVLKGWAIAMVFGIPVGIIMGLSKKFNAAFGGIVHALRQIPMMSWVPLTIIWFGIGDGPTLFMIALNGIFQIVLNTSKGVQDISQDYFNAARSMGANKRSIFKNIVLPGALPDILVGARLALGGGWMSVI